MRVMYIRALCVVETTDLEEIWRLIHNYNRVNLGGEDSRYAVYFTGTISDGLEVLRVLLEQTECEVKISVSFALGGCHGEEIQEVASQGEASSDSL